VTPNFAHARAKTTQPIFTPLLIVRASVPGYCIPRGIKLQKFLFPHFYPKPLHFQPKRAKYWKWHIIKTTTSIATKFCTMIKTTKYSSRVVLIRTQRIQDGGQPPSWKILLHRDISATVWQILTTFGAVTHIGPYTELWLTVKIPNFCKSKIATADNIKIDKLQYTLAKYRPISTKNFYGNGYRDS